MSVFVEKHVIRFNVSMNKTHKMYRIQREYNFGAIKFSPFFWHVVIGHEGNEVTAWHVIHDHVKVLVILKGKVQLHDPLWIGVGHDVTFFPEESRVGTFYLQGKASLQYFFLSLSSRLIFFENSAVFTISNLLSNFIAYTFWVELCLTNCTSPNAPLPITFISVKSSVRIRNLQMSWDTESSGKLQNVRAIIHPVDNFRIRFISDIEFSRLFHLGIQILV